MRRLRGSGFIGESAYAEQLDEATERIEFTTQTQLAEQTRLDTLGEGYVPRRQHEHFHPRR